MRGAGTGPAGSSESSGRTVGAPSPASCRGGRAAEPAGRKGSAGREGSVGRGGSMVRGGCPVCSTAGGAESMASRSRRWQTGQWRVRCPSDEAADRWARSRARVSCLDGAGMCHLPRPHRGRPCCPGYPGNPAPSRRAGPVRGPQGRMKRSAALPNPRYHLKGPQAAGEGRCVRTPVAGGGGGGEKGAAGRGCAGRGGREGHGGRFPSRGRGPGTREGPRLTAGPFSIVRS